MLNNLIKKYISIMLIIMLTAALCISAGAVTVNDHEAHTDSIVDYAVHVVACPAGIQAIDMSVYYDSSSLEYIPGSANADEVSDAMMNDTQPGEIRYNALSLEGFDFTDDTTLLSVKFRVKNELTSDVNLYYTVKNFVDNNSSDLKGIYTYDITHVEDDKSSDSVSSAIVIEPDVSSEISESSAAAASSKVSDKGSKNNKEDTDNKDNKDNKDNNKDNIEVEEESDVDSVDLQDTFEITSQISHATQDIPLNQAIKFDSPDTPDNKSNIGKSNKYRILFMSCIVGIAILIVVILIIIFKDNKKGKHYA